MFRILNIIGVLFALAGCASYSVLEGEVISSKLMGEGIAEHLIQTKNAKIPYFKIRTNKHNLYQGSKVAIELP